MGLGLLVHTCVHMGSGHWRAEGIQVQKSSNVGFIPLLAAVGMIPCPGSVVMLTFCISIVCVGVGLLSVLFIALGMAVTISAVGVVAISARQVILKMVLGRVAVWNVVLLTTEFLGYSLIAILGLILLIGTSRSLPHF
jgi:ABC-type nickel/cobalt efflux system permease component RcnA